MKGKTNLTILLQSIVIMLFLICCKKDPTTMPAPIIVPPKPFVLNVSIPNTAPHGVFTITTNDTAQETLQLYNRWGEQLLNQTINGTTTIDMVGLTNGTYFFMLITHTKTFKGTITFIY